MKWREIVLAFANAARHREGNSIPNPGNSRPDDVAFAEGAAFAYSVMAEEMEYITKLAPHEALEHVRKLAALKYSETKAAREAAHAAGGAS